MLFSLPFCCCLAHVTATFAYSCLNARTEPDLKLSRLNRLLHGPELVRPGVLGTHGHGAARLRGPALRPARAGHAHRDGPGQGSRGQRGAGGAAGAGRGTVGGSAERAGRGGAVRGGGGDAGGEGGGDHEGLGHGFLGRRVGSRDAERVLEPLLRSIKASDPNP